MTFKCPKCKKDFGKEIKKLNKHFKENPKCAIKALELYTERMKASHNIKS